MRKTVALVGVGLVGLLLTAGLAFAFHSWNGWHWHSDNLSPTVSDQTSSSLYDVPEAVSEWAALNTDIQPAMTSAKKADIKVREGFSWSWLGQATVFIEDGHITKGEVRLNTKLLSTYGPGAADYVLCQEIGHVLGLDHNPSSNTTCMNDTLDLDGIQLDDAETSPNSHDTKELSSVYGHADESPPGEGDGNGGGGGPPCEKNPNHKKCQDGNGHWVTVHEFPVP